MNLYTKDGKTILDLYREKYNIKTSETTAEFKEELRRTLNEINKAKKEDRIREIIVERPNKMIYDEMGKPLFNHSAKFIKVILTIDLSK